MQREDRIGQNEWTWASFLLLLLAVVALAGLTSWLGFALMPSDSEVRVTAVVSGVSALFSGLAFAGVIYSLGMQQRELALQRAELAQTRRILSDQNATMNQQRFESSFFNLLKAHRDLVVSTTAVFERTSSMPVGGQHAYGLAAQELSSLFHARISPVPTAEAFAAYAGTLFAGVCLKPHSDFGNYFRSLYHLVHFVEKAEVADKWPYLQLVRAQLSNGEQLLIFFYCLTPDGRGLKSYVERFHLLRGLREAPGVSDLRSHFRKAAFGATKRTRLAEPPELSA